MKYDVLRDAEKYTKVHKRKRLRHRVVTVLAGVVVFCTTYALILPAITLEKQCDIPEHTHTDACYAQVTSVEKRVPVCSAETLEIHRHTADCYDANGNPTCGYADFVVHSHDSRCYDETGNLWCPLPEIEAHRHTADCYALPEEHTHAEGCYTSVRGDLVCGEHVHTDACYTETAVLACGLEESEEHRHDESCYETSRELTCGIDSDHSHTDACYEWEQVLSCDLPTEPAEDAQPVLVCTKPEIVLHRHTPDCFDADGKLICGQTQVLEHRHSDACFETVAEPVDTGTLTCTDTAHVHTARCYGTWELVCGQEEHTHSEACKQEETVFCGKDAHTHGEACRDENGELVCGTEEHTHSLACYADPDADVETAELWEQTFAGVTLTGNWRKDTLAIAETQLGYTESTKNYVVAEDGETVKGYTRYGAWCEEPYGDWNVMFLTFCLHYAGVEGVDRDCGGWVTSWADAFEPAQSHTPAAGDLVLFDRDGDGTADRAGLVAQITDSGFAAMEGDAEDAVRLLTYGADDPGILGYINLPEGPKEFTLTAQTENGITVTITGESASLPYPAREITVTVTEVTDGERRAIRDQILGEEQAEPERSYLLDITLWHGEEEIEPTGSVTVTFSGIDTEGLYPKVYHIDTNAQTATDMEAKTGENGDVTVDTDHFSYYDLRLLNFQELSGYIGDAFTNGGEFQLTGDAWTADNGSSANLSITQNTTIDLNGHTLTISKSGQCFEVQDGATLTIIDSAAPQETVTDSGGAVYGNKATLENDALTYYITKSTPSGTGTTETLEQHTVTLTGAIRCDESSDQAIKVNGGTLDIQGGALRNSSGKRIVLMESGTLTMSGGYIVGGGSQGNPGGGIYVTNGTLNISGGVVAANRGNSGGGIYVNSGELNISGGAVAGNEVINGHSDNGGGIYVNSGTLNLSGGYVTNNYKECGCNDCRNDVNNTHGGGGIALANSSAMNMTGGYVTGNYSGLAGGGIYAGFFGHNVGFTMSGGTIAGNCAELGEGGGLRIAGGTNGVIQATNKVYITNNITNSNNDWGGGGIFVQEKGNLSIVNSLITNNSAGGFGGGVGACPTGETLIVNKDGAAIYGNEASGTNMSGGGNNKTYDSTLALNSTVFMSKGYADYFCVRKKEGANAPISLVTGLMAGGGAANWTGSCDEQPVSIGPSGYAAAKYLFGLDAHPDGTAKSQAVNAAKVIITGNHSNIHGGGIMTNGGLILGRKEEIVTATPALDITGTKALLKDGAAQESGRDFHFLLKNSAGEEVGTATADAATGQFTISPNVQYTQAGTYTYTLSEVNDNRPGITYDTNVHTIQVTIEEKTVSLLGVTFKSYNVASVTLDGSESGGSSGSGSGTGSQTGTFKVRYQNTNNWDIVNVYVWDADNRKIVGDWPGQPMTKDTTDDTYYYDLNVTGTGNYNYIFNNVIGGSGTQTKNITNIPYAPGKEAVFGANGDVVSNTAATGSSGSGDAVGHGSNSDGSYTLTIPGDAFTNTMTTQLNLQITKTDSADASKLLEGAKFTLKEQGTENSMEVTTDKDGIALFSGIRRNTTYDLRETQAPSNYMMAGPWILEVRDEDATLYPATENPDGTLEKASDTDTGTALTVTTGTDSKVLELPIQDTLWGYELPDTGGAGTTSYTAGGLALIFGAATLLYSHCRRRKEDEASS
ncbi:MAG: starch-binding protein [Oscillospiraceae bacterium]|nr:starch-binding protein [Oscillospiraceae bacterium]